MKTNPLTKVGLAPTGAAQTLLRPAQAAEFLGVGEFAFRRAVELGKTPQPDGRDEAGRPVWHPSTLAPLKTTASSELRLRIEDPVLVSGTTLTVHATTAKKLGMVAALVFELLHYEARRRSGGEWSVSFTTLVQRLPLSRSAIFEAVHDLKQSGIIVSTTNGGIGCYRIKNPLTAKGRRHFFSPAVARCLGINEAILLQAVHVRHHDSDGSGWVLWSLAQLQTDLPWVSRSTIKRLVSRLLEARLLLSKPQRIRSTGQHVNAFRVGYVALAEQLGVHCPSVPVPSLKQEWGSPGPWVHPLMPQDPCVVVLAA